MPEAARDPERRRFVIRASAVGVVSITAASLARIARATSVSLPRSVAGEPLPDTAVTRAAVDLASAAMPPFLFNHCMRTYVFGAIYARQDKIAFDHEMMFCAAALHDLGLVERYASKGQPFEMDSADAAKQLLERHGVTGPRAELVWNAVAMHASALLSHQAPAAQLVGSGAGADVGGYRIATLPPQRLAEVLQAFPRLGFKTQFEGLLLDYCKRKPLAQLGTWTDDFCRRHNHDVTFPVLEKRIDASPFAE